MEHREPKSDVFANSLQQTLSKLTEAQLKEVQACFGNSNDRQKLKTIKRVLQNPTESPLKRTLLTHFQPPILHQYIFGNLQPKPTLLNTFKSLPISLPIFLSLHPMLHTFPHTKQTIQIIQTLTLSNLLPRHGPQYIQLVSSPLFKRICEILVQEMKIGVESVVNNLFRTKWLDYFVEVLRCVNYVVKYVKGVHQEGVEVEGIRGFVAEVGGLAERAVEVVGLLNKEVITQLYIMLVLINNQLPMPQSNLQKIHYLHARTVVLNQQTLTPLLILASQLKDTQQKSQLTPILLKSFLDYFQQGKKKGIQAQLNEQLKNNAFDWAISLFDVGRSIYSYLEEIVDIIMGKGGLWSLEGNFTRKFFIARVALRHVGSGVVLGMWPTCLEDCFVESGNMTMAYVTDCAEALLLKIYQQLNQDYEKWMQVWLQPYKKTLLSASRTHIRGITQFINPILLKINSSNSLLLKQISLLPQDNINSRLGIIALLRCYKQIGKIQSKHNVYFQQEEKKVQMEKNRRKGKLAKQESKSQTIQRVTNFNPKTQKLSFIHLDDSTFSLDCNFLLDLLLSNDSMSALQTLQFLITTRKPSILILPQQFNLIIEFYYNCLKTSMPQYRKCYLNLTKRLLERLRKNYDKDLLEGNKEKQKEMEKEMEMGKEKEKEKEKEKGKKKQYKATEYFQEFVQFLNKLIEICFFNVYPDAIFEVVNPGLEILTLIVNIFGPKGCEIRKGTFIEPCQLLCQRTKFFSERNFFNLVICLQSSYQSIRSLSHQLLKTFPTLPRKTSYSLQQIFNKSLQNTNKLSIKSYQFACRILTYISTININNNYLIKQIPSKHSIQQFNVCQYLLNILRQRYFIFKKQFVDQGDLYYNHLLHGVLTCFSYLLEAVAESRKQEFGDDQAGRVKEFLRQFFMEIINILNFSVEISSANVSTVVLDTIANASQTDKKMTVDCRGHFLFQKKDQQKTGKAIGNYLDSTALLTSMQSQEEGIENTLVVSFYLLTRESGLVFQSIGSLMSNPLIAKHMPKKQLIELVNTYFFALINLKHMGSVDRISNGLSKMAKVIFDQDDTDLTKVPQTLLNQLLQFLTDGKFTNILRRSAGVPYAFSCLLKCQAIKRKQLIQKTIKTLLSLSKQQTNSPIQLRIHSLNILKKLFQDSDLKQDLDIYVSEAFISSIRGFTSQEWGVRNSSLMLFSVLANRTLGIKPTFNLLEFFHKCPDLLDFITKQLAQKRAPTMYPPLYPIVLLLSRLLPFDLRERVRLSIKGPTNKQMRKQQLLNLQPLVREAGNNHNYMGRVMTAKAILPFMFIGNILPHCLGLLEVYMENVKNKKIINNNQHYRLTQCYQLFVSYHQIVDCCFSQSVNAADIVDAEVKERMREVLTRGAIYLNKLPYIAPTVHQIYIRIHTHILSTYIPNSPTLPLLLQNMLPLLHSLTTSKTRIGDLGHSLMYKSCIQLISVCYKNILNNGNSTLKDVQIGRQFIQYLNCQNSLRLDQQTDYQMLCLVLGEVVGLGGGGKWVQGLKEWLGKVDIQRVENDATIIKILSIYTANPSMLQPSKLPHLLKTLQHLQKCSQNKHLKVSIFQYLLSLQKTTTQSLPTSLLQHQLLTYSTPQQLQDLRQCCILYLQQATSLSPSLLLVYIRMLEDQEYQIRKRAAYQISRLLGIPACNQQVVLKELLGTVICGSSYVGTVKARVGGEEGKSEGKSEGLGEDRKLELLEELLNNNSDYVIRQKNHNEQRIFSYDKPNKYRTDLNTFLEYIILLTPQELQAFSKMQTQKQQKEKIQGKQEKDEDKVEDKVEDKDEKIVKMYLGDIMERNQYQFETIMRGIVGGCGVGKLAVFEQVMMEQPILEQLYRKCQQATKL